jgi:hypothetical protein
MRETTMETKHGWNVLDHEAALLYREYKFDGGLATTVVFRGKDDGLIVISPGGGVDVAGLDELKEYAASSRSSPTTISTGSGSRRGESTSPRRRATRRSRPFPG